MWKINLVSIHSNFQKEYKMRLREPWGTLKALLFLKMPEAGPTVKKCHLSSHCLLLKSIITNNLSNCAYIPMSVHLHYWSLRCHHCQGALWSTEAVLCQLRLAARLLPGSQSWQANMLIEFISLGFDRQLKQDSTSALQHCAAIMPFQEAQLIQRRWWQGLQSGNIRVSGSGEAEHARQAILPATLIWFLAALAGLAKNGGNEINWNARHWDWSLK